MKLLFICHIAQHALDDTVRAIRYMGAEMTRRGHQVDYFFRRKDSGNEPLSWLEWPMRVAPLASKKCQQKEYDLILSTGSSGWCLSSFRHWLLPEKTRIVSWHAQCPTKQPPLQATEQTDIHSLAKDFPPAKNLLIKQLSGWTVEQSLKTQDGCFITALEEFHRLRNDFPEFATKTLYQPRGVASHFYSPQRLKQKGSKPSRLLFIGQWNRDNQATQTLVDAFSRVRSLHPQATLTVAGTELPSEEQLFSDFPPEVRNALHRVQLEEEGNLPDLYLQHDVFIQPQSTTGLPLAVLEAMASAMPTVVAQEPDFQEVLSHYESGLLVPPNDTNALAESVTHLLENPVLCQELGEAAFETVSRCYTWHQVCDIFEANLMRIFHQKLT